MHAALLVVFYALSGALAVAINWIIWSFVYRLFRDEYRRLRDRSDSEGREGK